MPSPTKKLLLRIAAPLVALLAACGGNVVVDGSEGSGAATTQTGTATTVPGAGGASCFSLPPASSLMPCGSSGSSGGSCVFSYCDSSSTDEWEADCSGSACQCLLNGTELCTCALGVAGDICTGTPDCCFH